MIWKGKQIILTKTKIPNRFEMWLAESSGMFYVGSLSGRTREQAIYEAKNFFDTKGFITW